MAQDCIQTLLLFVKKEFRGFSPTDFNPHKKFIHGDRKYLGGD
jgi:hypothetical protein